MLAPLPIVAIWFGGLVWSMLTALAAAVMAWEWGRLCHRRRIEPPASSWAADAMPVEIALVAVVLAAVAIAALGESGLAVAAALAGAGLVFWAAHRSAGAKPGCGRAGCLWVGLPCVSCCGWRASRPAVG